MRLSPLLFLLFFLLVSEVRAEDIVPNSSCCLSPASTTVDPLAEWKKRRSGPKIDAQVLQSLKRKAEQGDVQTQMGLGWRYQDGQGVDLSQTEALKWYLMAANQGSVVAMEIVGNLYRMNSGVKPDIKKALKWLTLASKHGKWTATMQLARMYQNGEGVAQSHTKAYKWNRRAAEQGSPMAMLILGYTYRDGQKGSVKRDHHEALKWFRSAAQLGIDEAQIELGDMYAKGDVVNQDWQEALFWSSLAQQSNGPYQEQLDKTIYQDQIDEAARHLSSDQIATVKQRVAEWMTSHAPRPLRSSHP